MKIKLQTGEMKWPVLVVPAIYNQNPDPCGGSSVTNWDIYVLSKSFIAMHWPSKVSLSNKYVCVMEGVKLNKKDCQTLVLLTALNSVHLLLIHVRQWLWNLNMFVSTLNLCNRIISWGFLYVVDINYKEWGEVRIKIQILLGHKLRHLCYEHKVAT